MPLKTINDESLQEAASLIRKGSLVAFPTETVYGLGADVFNTDALARIFEAKGRPRFDPLIVHIAAEETLEKIADLAALDSGAQKNLALLTRHFWPGPLTLVLPKNKAVPDLATSGLPTVAVRFPAHKAAQRLITLSGTAIAAPSANPFGKLSPTRAEHVLAGLGEKVAMILDGGPTKIGLESTVLDLCQGQPCLLRPGGTPKEAIEALIGELGPCPAPGSAQSGGLASPGMLKSHYAPQTSLAVHDLASMCRTRPDKDSAWLFFDGASHDAWLSALDETGMELQSSTYAQVAAIAVLSETGDILEAAANLFETLHELDSPGIKQIHAQLAPEKGLGLAINDRLHRAVNG